MTTYLLIGYAVIAVVLGYLSARAAYHEPKKPGMLTGSFGGAIFVWIVHGLMWPLLVLVGLIILLYGFAAERGVGRSLGNRLFGSK